MTMTVTVIFKESMVTTYPGHRQSSRTLVIPNCTGHAWVEGRLELSINNMVAAIIPEGNILMIEIKHE